ncbi:MAG TPA: adenylyltransferase/cytidyltransferase family protein [Nevskiales bacterium]|nr:adenylyltransferase/cytidyltransferase family protein [Nevskiales bacterium]
MIPVAADLRPVLVVGVFDLFHRGHVELLRRARELGSCLHVVVNGDHLTSAYKRRPVMTEDDRLAIVSACRYVDRAEVSNDYDIKPYVERHGIRVIVHGDDWERASYLHQIRVTEDYLRARDMELVFLPYYRGESTSDLRRRIREERP